MLKELGRTIREEFTLWRFILWIILVVGLFWSINYGLAIWIRIGVAIYVATGIHLAWSSKVSKVLVAKWVIIASFCTMGLCTLLLYVILGSTSPAILILGGFTLSFAIFLIIQKAMPLPNK